MTSHRTRARAFTLMEILISMTLFTVIGVAVVLLMRTGIDMWVRGNQGSQQEDRLEQSLPRLEEDLRMVRVPAQHDRIPFDPKNPDPEKEPAALPPANRFVSGYKIFKLRDAEYRCRFVAFVRDIAGLAEIETYATRAGTNPKADAWIDGKEDEKEFQEHRHLPHGGQIEVLWIWLPDADRPGVGTVYRAYRAPIGGKGTLLDPANYGGTVEELKEQLAPQPLFQDVVLFDMYFWTQYTTTWEWSKGEPSVTSRPADPAQLAAGRGSCGPSRTWDSTRGLLPKSGEFGFLLSRGKESLNFSGDDIWPRMLRVEFALKEDETTLAGALGASDRSFTVRSADFATGRGEIDGSLMKIGPEWLKIIERDGSRRDTFHIDRRGLRGTATIVHAEGEPVYFGRIFDLTINIPSFRDDNN